MTATVHINVLLDELNLLRENTTCYLNPSTAEIYTVTAADRSLLELVDDPEYVEEDEREEIEKVHRVTHSKDFLALPGVNEFEQAMSTEAFCDYLGDGSQATAFRAALDGRGLEPALAKTELTEPWYAFKDETLSRITRQWLEEKDIPYTEED